MKFYEFAKWYLKNKYKEVDTEITSIQAYDLRKDLRSRIQMLLYPYYFVLGDKICEMEICSTFLNADSTTVMEQMENECLEFDIYRTGGCALDVNNDDEEIPPFAKRQSLFDDVSNVERVLFELLLDNIDFRGNESNGFSIKEGHWEILSKETRMRLIQCLNLVSQDKMKWPVDEFALQRICMKLLHSQTFAYFRRRDEMRTYIRQTDIVDLLDDKLFDDLYEFLFEKRFSKKSIKKEWDAIDENFAQYVEEKYLKQIEENLLEKETKE